MNNITELKQESEIWAHNLTKIYGKGESAVNAVKGIDLIMKPGVHGFLGPNGAGKTTTMNMLIGAISITKGSAFIKGKKAGSIEARKRIGFLPQNPKFDKNMTGEEYLTFIGQMSGLKKNYSRKRAQELLFELDLWDARMRKIKNYSGGMQQKIGLASVLVRTPDLLILDEPTANLDPIGREQIINTIKEISSNISIFVSSHILSEIEQMCDTVTIINKGKVVLSDKIENVKRLFKGDI
ncbi:MAG: ABC transporter ATP-binding protein, partial [Candidatus Lokiarchaeota archaeon]